MNKSKIFLLAAVTALAGGALVGVASFTRANSAFSKASGTDDSVQHTITLTYEELDWEDKGGGYYEVGFITETDAENIFTSTSGYAIDATEEGASQGDSEHNYICKINHIAFGKDKPNTQTVFSISFETGAQIEGYTGTVYYSTYSDYGSGVVKDNNNPASMDIEFFYIDDNGYYLYTVDYEFAFSKTTQKYVTIDSIVLSYSCNY